MDISEKYHFLINKLATGSAEFTKAEQETLAIIAYKQPIKQSVVIKIRGNKSYDHISQLKEKGLISSEKLGRSRLLKLTPHFFDYFDVSEKEVKEELSKTIPNDLKSVLDGLPKPIQ